MPHDPNVGSDGHRHVYRQRRPGYSECEHCGNRCIDRAFLADGMTPTDEDLKWLHHGNWPPQNDTAGS